MTCKAPPPLTHHNASSTWCASPAMPRHNLSPHNCNSFTMPAHHTQVPLYCHPNMAHKPPPSPPCCPPSPLATPTVSFHHHASFPCTSPKVPPICHNPTPTWQASPTPQPCPSHPSLLPPLQLTLPPPLLVPPNVVLASSSMYLFN